MKKSVFATAMAVIFFNLSYAQESRHKEKTVLSLGVIGTVDGITEFKEHPLQSEYGVAPSINLITKITRHHVMYETLSNSFQTMHGVNLPKEFDLYAFYQRSFARPDHKYSLGLEKLIQFGRTEFSVFTELGKNSINDHARTYLSFGITMHPQFILWKK